LDAAREPQEEDGEAQRRDPSQQHYPRRKVENEIHFQFQATTGTPVGQGLDKQTSKYQESSSAT
jgi:hypothetical protein